MERRSGSAVVCLKCGHGMTPGDQVQHPGGGPTIEIYECPNCRVRAAVMFEPRASGLTSDEQSWVEREVAARGSFFPGDYDPGRGRFR